MVLILRLWKSFRDELFEALASFGDLDDLRSQSLRFSWSAFGHCLLRPFQELTVEVRDPSILFFGCWLCWSPSMTTVTFIERRGEHVKEVGYFFSSLPDPFSKYDLNESGFIVSNIRQISPKTKVKLLLNRTQKVNDFTKMEIEYKEALSESGQVIDFSIPNTNLIRKYIDFGQNPFIGKSKAKEAFKEIIKRLVSEL
jgi:hypothetical protein